MIELMQTGSAASSIVDDNSNLPYPPNTPFKGITRSANFINGNALASAIGLTAGVAVNSDAGWLHFIEDTGVELYISKKPLRTNLSWDDINNAQNNNVKEVMINGVAYVIRFINGLIAATDYAWQRYMLNVYNSADRAGFPANTPYWGDYTYTMLGVANTNETTDGVYTLCNEMNTSPAGRAIRGRGLGSTDKGITSFYVASVQNTPAPTYGWRPMLVKKSTIPYNPFNGEYSQASFITFSSLVSTLGVTGGTVLNDTAPWFKFTSTTGAVLYMPKRSIRSGLLWEYLHSKGLAYGTTTITISGNVYKVRLILSAPADPGNTTVGREWVEYVVNLNNGKYGNYTTTDLGTGLGTAQGGELVVSQEANTRGGYGAAGYSAITGLWYQPANTTNAGYGWRPVLELMGPVGLLNRSTKIATMPVARANFAAAIDNTRIHIFGGQSVPGPTNVQTYSRLTKSGAIWSTSANIAPFAWTSGGASVGGFFYAAGGHNGSAYTTLVWKLDPVAGTGVNVAPLTDGARGNAKLVAFDNNTLYMTGGLLGSNSQIVPYLHKYDIAANTWTRLADMPMELSGHYTGVYGGKLYVAGGAGNAGVAQTALREYDPVANIWTTIANAPVASSWVGGCVHKNYFVIGRVVGAYIVLDIYDFIAKTWTLTQTAVPARWAGEFVGDDTGVYILGGSTSSTIGSGNWNTAPRYDEVIQLY